MNFYSIVEQGAANWPAAVAIADSERCLTYQKLKDATERLATDLKCAGIQKGNRIGVIFPRGIADIVACFAVMRAGGIVVQISAAWKASEIVQLSERMDIDGFCYSPQFDALIPQGGKKQFLELPLQDTRPVWLQCFATHGLAKERRQQLLNLNTASIGFSSGTTSESKGIIISHDALLARTRTETRIFSLIGNDTILYLLAIAYAVAPPIGATLLKGGEVVFADTADMPLFPDLIGQHGVTVVYASPLVYRMMLNEGKTLLASLRSVKHFVTTGSVLAGSTAEEFSARVGREIIQRYGLNECGAVMGNLSADRDKRGSVGRPCEFDVALRNERGVCFGGPSHGELLLRGPGLFDGYYSPWRPRDEVLENGWFCTGDLGKRDEDGYFWIVGRVKDMINVGGVKVFPTEIEAVLNSHPEVEEALVFGVPDPRFGEVPHAKVKRSAGSQIATKELMRYVNERVSLFKALRSVELVNELPKTVSGKIRRERSSAT